MMTSFSIGVLLGTNVAVLRFIDCFADEKQGKMLFLFDYRLQGV